MPKFISLLSTERAWLEIQSIYVYVCTEMNILTQCFILVMMLHNGSVLLCHRPV